MFDPVTSRRRQRVFAVSAAVLGFAVALLLAEALLRAVRTPPERLDIVVEPGGKYQAPDPVLGFRPLPGSYRVLFDHRYPWRLTNLPDSTRITRPLATYAGSPPRAGVWVFGCSFTQGWGVDDDETMPWKLQERLPAHDVVNFGVGGYGTLQSLLQYRRALKERPTPAAAILIYADFHDQRNVRTAAWRDANFNYERFGTIAQPYVRFDGSGGLRMEWGSGDVPMMAMRSRFEVFDVAVIGFGVVRDAFLRSHAVSERLIEQFVEESRTQGVEFVLAGIWPSDGTRATLRRFARQGVPAVDISVNQRDPRNQIPYDGHPSAVANEQHAVRLLATLTHARIIDRTPSP
jgi:hypothetical protein